MTVQIKLGERPVRTTTAKIDQEDGTTGELPVEYYSMTIAQIKARNERVEAAKNTPEKTLYLSDTLAEQLHALPSVSDAKGKPIKITAANLEQLEVHVLTAIQKAIDEDMAPKSQPAK